MSRPRLRIELATALGCAFLALSGTAASARADPAQAIRSDAHRLARDVHREAHAAGQQLRSDAHQLHRQLAMTRDRARGELHHLAHRIQRWWSRVRVS